MRAIARATSHVRSNTPVCLRDPPVRVRARAKQDRPSPGQPSLSRSGPAAGRAPPGRRRGGMGPLGIKALPSWNVVALPGLGPGRPGYAATGTSSQLMLRESSTESTHQKGARRKSSYFHLRYTTAWVDYVTCGSTQTYSISLDDRIY